MTIAFELAQRITALDYDSLPSAAVQWAKVGILDTVGVTLAGNNDPSATIVARARWARRPDPRSSSAPRSA